MFKPAPRMEKTERDVPSSRQTLLSHGSTSGYRCLTCIVHLVYHIIATDHIELAAADDERVKRIHAAPDDVHHEPNDMCLARGLCSRAITPGST
jgi:hypothetical protein